MTDEQQRPVGEDEMTSVRRSFSVIGAELCNLLSAVAPAEAQRHFQSAHVEALKGLRALIDHRIDRLSRGGRKGVSIDVE